MPGEWRGVLSASPSFDINDPPDDRQNYIHNYEYEYARFESLARQLVNTPKLKASAADLPLPVDSGGEPADDRPEREEADRYGY